MTYILSIDQSLSQTKVLLVDQEGKIPFVEKIDYHAPRFLDNLLGLIKTILQKHKINPMDVERIAIASALGQISDNMINPLGVQILQKLTNNKSNCIDVSSAHELGLLDVNTLSWDTAKTSHIANLPQIKNNIDDYGQTDLEIFAKPVPITCMIPDHHASLFTHKDPIKCTLGKHVSFVARTDSLCSDTSVSTAIWKFSEKPLFGIQKILDGGSILTWLKSSLGLVLSVQEVEGLATSMPTTNGVQFIKTEKSYAITNMTLQTNIGHVARAILEGLAQNTKDALDTLKDYTAITSLKCDGKMVENVFFMQTLSSKTDIPLLVFQEECTGLGAAYLAATFQNLWKKEDLHALWKGTQTYTPEKDLKHLKKA